MSRNKLVVPKNANATLKSLANLFGVHKQRTGRNDLRALPTPPPLVDIVSESLCGALEHHGNVRYAGADALALQTMSSSTSRRRWSSTKAVR